MQAVVALDVGTSSVRAIIYSLNGRELYRRSYSYSPDFLHDGRVRQKCSCWEDGVFQVLEACGRFTGESAEKVEILAISVTSQRASVIPVDRAGTPLYNAIMWQDKTTLDECSYIESRISREEVYGLTGLHIDPYFSAPKILWLKSNEPDIFSAAEKFIGVQDYVVMLLTGEYVTDYSQACRTQLLDVSTGQWSSRLLEITSIKEKHLPAVVPPGSAAGTLLHGFARAAGLPPDIPVIIAGGDQQVAAIGMGVIGPGSVEANTGTGSFIISPVDAPLFHPEMKTLCSMAAVPGRWVVEAGVLTTGILYSWFADEFANSPEGDGFAKINRLVEEVSPGSNGVIVLPHFKGSAAPFWNPKAKGLFFNLTLASTRGEMARAVLESIVLEMGANLGLIRDLVPVPIEKTVVAGGLTRFPLFNQLQADVFNTGITLPVSSEAQRQVL